jgi:uncharacterized DUF497 family protein
MAISFDPAKREETLADRGLDFADAEQVFAGLLIEGPDTRFDYGEERIVTVGFLGERMVVVVWTARGEDRHIISMRKANARERQKYEKQLGRSG